MITSSLLQRVEKCDIECINLANQQITFNEYLKLTSSKKVTVLILDGVKIIDDDGIVVSLDRILAKLPKLNKLSLKCNTFNESIFPPKIAQKLVQLPVFKKLGLFALHNITTALNIGDFCAFILKHRFQKVKYHFHMDASVPNDYRKKFYAAMNKIIDEWQGNHELVITVNGLEYPF
uniref:Uncharacterized protein n=1 Tax=Panagrolaimus sp. ES5 TaxID=591445 RepID=A0AC34GAH7_9BILA